MKEKQTDVCCPVLPRVIEDPTCRMWRLLAPLYCLLALTSAWSNSHLHPLSDELVNFINKQNTTWQVRGGCSGRGSAH